MRSTSWIILLLCAGCTAHVAPTVSPSKETASAAVQPASLQAASQETDASRPPEKLPEAVTQVVEHNDAAVAASEESAESGDDEAGDDELADAVDTDEGEAGEATSSTVVPNGPLYTSEWSDEQLTELWKKHPASLGSISVGFVESGRMVNSVQFPQGEEWIVVSPELAWGTQETVDYVTRAIREVRAQYPKAPQLRVNQISSRDGGYLRPHKSHQNGRDVDLGFYYPTVDPIRARERERYIDLELNWALLKALAMHADVQMILVDKRVQKVLYDYALRKGENKAWLDSLFNDGAKSLIKHAKRHRDHFHVRFFNPRAQELGRRIAPLLALQPDKNIQMHRVRSGDTLGGIALRYGSSIQGIKKANRMRNTFLRIGQVLSVPLRGPCTRCPVPPPVVVPPRRMPPELEQQAPAVAAKQAPEAASAAGSEQPVVTAPGALAQPAVAAPPAAVEPQPAMATQQAPASPEPKKPAVEVQRQDTGGSEPPSAETGTQQQAPEAPAQEPAVQGTPAHTSAAVMQIGPAASR
ncbi:penicillin-insensitive murein endopeptidase [Vitiosangium sp. GDMCC 1.1324]|uniref:LysM peptidoglycan-binding domain-containing protein n=1 Tax=Vitiosangium sp. (strain GDMCC 1.1324) TaxID=2138576 RepID=UPI001E323BA3|nr:penicillin-insensitive murein endopeptidase [Vitiosangium sp. GDMCC 1.1324]